MSSMFNSIFLQLRWNSWRWRCRWRLFTFVEIPWKPFLQQLKYLQYIIFDTCSAQNWNHTLSRFLSIMTLRFTTVHHYLSKRGHSFLENDREFAVCSSKTIYTKYNRIYNLKHYVEIIADAADRFIMHDFWTRYSSFWIFLEKLL